MHSKLVFYILLIALILAGGWGLVRLDILTLTTPEKHRITSTIDKAIGAVKPNIIDVVQTSNDDNILSPSATEIHFASIKKLILSGNSRQAVNNINQHYSFLSRDQLNQLKQDFLNTAARANNDKKKNTLVAASRVFDELDIWKALANAAVTSFDWQLAFDAQLRASELENDSVELEALLKRMVKSSGYLRAEYEKNNDQLSIKTLYQRLTNLHPHVGLFQLKLANAHVQLNDYQAAENIYTSLSYDPEFSVVAQQALAKIRDLEAKQHPVASIQNPEDSQRSNDIVVPLIAAGSSFLVDVSIERQHSRLLLDTGASITALSTELIQRLKLTPTGQSIQLSTANGITSSLLYRANSLSLGRLTLTNMIVAEIGLSRRSGFDGLLGTDALNQFKSQYSYIIDNQKSALIFRAR